MGSSEDELVLKRSIDLAPGWARQLSHYLSFNLHNWKRLKSLAFTCIRESEAWRSRITCPSLQFMRVAELVMHPYSSFASDGLLPHK